MVHRHGTRCRIDTIHLQCQYMVWSDTIMSVHPIIMYRYHTDMVWYAPYWTVWGGIANLEQDYLKKTFVWPARAGEMILISYSSWVLWLHQFTLSQVCLLSSSSRGSNGFHSGYSPNIPIPSTSPSTIFHISAALGCFGSMISCFLLYMTI